LFLFFSSSLCLVACHFHLPFLYLFIDFFSLLLSFLFLDVSYLMFAIPFLSYCPILDVCFFHFFILFRYYFLCVFLLSSVLSLFLAFLFLPLLNFFLYRSVLQPFYRLQPAVDWNTLLSFFSLSVYHLLLSDVGSISRLLIDVSRGRRQWYFPSEPQYRCTRGGSFLVPL
jgi:hypothetical protein